MLLNFYLSYWVCARYPHHLSFFIGWIIACLWISFLGISTENLPAQLRQRYEPDLEPCSTCSYIFCILSKNFFPQHLLKSFKFSYLSIAPEKNISGIQQFCGGQLEEEMEQTSAENENQCPFKKGTHTFKLLKNIYLSLLKSIILNLSLSDLTHWLFLKKGCIENSNLHYTSLRMQLKFTRNESYSLVMLFTRNAFFFFF